jgi:predicted RNA methylase
LLSTAVLSQIFDRLRTGTQAFIERVYREKGTTIITLLNFSLPLPRTKKAGSSLMRKDKPA